mgnify:CR=1 FL=1
MGYYKQKNGKYLKFGDFLKQAKDKVNSKVRNSKVLQTTKDVALGGLDLVTAPITGALGMDSVSEMLGDNIDGLDTRSTTKIGKGIKGVAKGVSGVTEAAAPVVANALLPGSGTVLKAAQTAIDQTDVGDGVSQHASQSGAVNMDPGAQQVLNSAAGLASKALGDIDIASATSFAKGGQLTEFTEGGSHEANPNGGIELGSEQFVEEGETQAQGYVFSDRLKINKRLAKEFNIPEKYAGTTFSDYSKKIDKKYNKVERKNDSISERAIEKEIANLTEAQEAYKSKKLSTLLTNLSAGEGSPLPSEAPTPSGGPSAQLFAKGGPLGMEETNPYMWGEFPGSSEGIQATQPNQYNKAYLSPEAEAAFFSSSRVRNARSSSIPDKHYVDGKSANSASTAFDLNEPIDAEPALAVPNVDSVVGDYYDGLAEPFANAFTENADDKAALKRAEQSGSNTEAEKSNPARYAGAFANAANLGYLSRNKPIVKDLDMFTTDIDFEPNLVNREQHRRDVEDQAGAARLGVRDAASGSGSSFYKMLQNVQNSTASNLARFQIGADEADSRELARAQALNFAQSQGNERMRMSTANMNDADDQVYTAAMMDQIAALGNSVGGAATQMDREKMANSATNYDIFGNYLPTEGK